MRPCRRPSSRTIEPAASTAIVEELVDRGTVRNGHDPPVRRELARSLHSIVECLSSAYETSALGPNLLVDVARKELWPTPHSKLFDFDATVRGAEYIDELAAKARARMIPAGRRVIGHGDWRAEHVRFDGDLPTIAFDWDSLHKVREPALVGSTAHMFCADWSKEGHIQGCSSCDRHRSASRWTCRRPRNTTDRVCRTQH